MFNSHKTHFEQPKILLANHAGLGHFQKLSLKPTEWNKETTSTKVEKSSKVVKESFHDQIK